MAIMTTISIIIIFNAIKHSISNMSNIKKSVANIQHTTHTISANITMPIINDIINDKHPFIIAFYYKYNNFFLNFLNIQIFL
jgi:hypothetical protein